MYEYMYFILVRHTIIDLLLCLGRGIASRTHTHIGLTYLYLHNL